MRIWKQGVLPLATLLAVSAIPLFSQAPSSTTKTPTVGANAKIQGSDAAIRGSGQDPAQVKHGDEVYLANCGNCHGATGKGTDVAPDLVRSPMVEDDVKGSIIGPVIKSGRPDKGMPALALSDQEISDVAAWLRVQVYGAAMRGTYSYLDILVGDPKKGEAYFNGAGKCSSCHSVTGDLAGIGSEYDPPTLQSRWVSGGAGGRGGAAAGRGRAGRGAAAPGLEPAAGDQSTYADTSPPPITKSTTTITVTLADGQKIDGVPIAISDFNLTFKDMNGGYHSIARNGDFPKVETHNPLAPHGPLLKTMSDDDMHNVTAYLVTVK
jgi:cytochrome c oxidase cbb3-type subunit 3